MGHQLEGSSMKYQDDPNRDPAAFNRRKARNLGQAMIRADLRLLAREDVTLFVRQDGEVLIAIDG